MCTTIKPFRFAQRRILLKLNLNVKHCESHWSNQWLTCLKLSSITRVLNEKIALIKTEDRLSRNFDDVDFTEGINSQICRLGSGKVLDDIVIALDSGDIRKKYAQEMQYLCGIHDGSEKQVGEGYWLCKAVAADIEHKTVVPLYLEAYSQEAADFRE